LPSVLCGEGLGQCFSRAAVTYCRAKGGRGSRSGLNSSGNSGRGQECRFRGRWRCCRWRCRWWWRYPWIQLLPLLLRSAAAVPAAAAAVASVSANGVTFATACAPANYSFCAWLAMAFIPRCRFSSQARDVVSHCALHNEWGRDGPREWRSAAVAGASWCARLSGHSCGDPRRRGDKWRSIRSCGWCLSHQRKPQQQQEQQQQQQ
jgi:hypothetical protein